LWFLQTIRSNTVKNPQSEIDDIPPPPNLLKNLLDRNHMIFNGYMLFDCVFIAYAFIYYNWLGDMMTMLHSLNLLEQSVCYCKKVTLVVQSAILGLNY